VLQLNDALDLRLLIGGKLIIRYQAAWSLQLHK